MSVALKKPVGNPNFKKGMKSPNPRGRPKGTGRPISPLRKTFNVSQKSEDLAQDIVAKVLKGDSVKKDQQDMAKWLLNFLVTANRAAQQDEAHRAALLRANENNEEENEEEDEEEEAPSKPKLLLEIVNDYDFVYEGQDREALASRGYVDLDQEDE